MNILSLFDGISCGRIALERAGIPVDNYFASEIDKFAMQVSKANWPDIQQVGDVCNVYAADLPKIDLLIGGSPCQGFSFAGKGLNFNDPRSALFFEYVRILNEIRKTNPDVIFLLENVPMKREHQMVISKYLGVDPIEINGALVSAQNRRRLFWTNIKAQPFNLFGDVVSMISQPKDKGILLKDILQLDEVGKKYYLSGKRLERMLATQGKYTQLNGEKSYCVTNRNTANWNGDFKKIAADGTLSQNQGKAGCFTAGGNSAGNHSDMDVIFIEQTPRGNNAGGQRALNGKTPSVSANSWENNNHLGGYRRLTPIEVERLFTLPDNYTASVSDSQRYRCMGNGWIVDVIAHIFSHIEK